MYFLVALAILQKVTTRFLMSVVPSVFPKGTSWFQLDAIHYIIQPFGNLSQNIGVIKIRYNNDTCHLYDTFDEDHGTRILTTVSIVFRVTMRNVSDQGLEEIKKTHFDPTSAPKIMPRIQ